MMTYLFLRHRHLLPADDAGFDYFMLMAFFSPPLP